MGLLDDAIREHLELKRRHGADPGEVARLEHEALGPARREPIAPVLSSEEDGNGHEGGHEPFVAETISSEDAPAAQEPADTAPTAPIELEQPTQHFDLADLEAAEDVVEPEIEPVAPPRPAPAPPAADQDDERDDVVAADEEPDADDVLEETPDFLQETPEHDRLWFEQKPPRDFDF